MSRIRVEVQLRIGVGQLLPQNVAVVGGNGSVIAP